MPNQDASESAARGRTNRADLLASTAMDFLEKRIPGLSRRDRRLLAYVKDSLLPPGDWPEGAYFPEVRGGHEGVDLRVASQLALLEEFRSEPYPKLFAALRSDPEIQTGIAGISYDRTTLLHNGFFPSPDAELYAAMILRHRPARLVEVGSGYSTMVARRAVLEGGLTTHITVIDPEPRRSVERAADEIRLKRVEDSELAAADFSPGDLLFIDSSHVCRAGGDLPYLFCRVLPALPPDVLIHVHDIFLPYDYPPSYVGRIYSEQYLLHALLAGGDRFEVVLAGHYLAREHSDAMRASISPGVGSHPYFFGASFWIRSR